MYRHIVYIVNYIHIVGQKLSIMFYLCMPKTLCIEFCIANPHFLPLVFTILFPANMKLNI